MPTPKRRPSKKAKAAIRTVKDSKLLATTRAGHHSPDTQDFRTPAPTPRTAAANKKRPNKKRG